MHSLHAALLSYILRAPTYSVSLKFIENILKKVLSLKKMSYFYNTVGIPELLYRVVSAKLRCELAIESGALIMLLKISTP